MSKLTTDLYGVYVSLKGLPQSYEMTILLQDTLLDADVAINAMMWQNGGMSGLDQWNFVMHPVDAAMTCDPEGSYVRQWCPEIAMVPNEFIHQPWKCPPSIMKRCKVELGIKICSEYFDIRPK